jgi:hypothetical protein
MGLTAKPNIPNTLATTKGCCTLHIKAKQSMAKNWDTKQEPEESKAYYSSRTGTQGKATGVCPSSGGLPNEELS